LANFSDLKGALPQTPVTLLDRSLFLFISFARLKEMNQRKGRRHL
jgi:hypothetical protein